MDRRIIRHGVTDSTSLRAFAALEEGTAAHGDVHLASAQTEGHGRLGREWSSPPGGDLYASVVLLPPAPGFDPVGLTMAVGLGVLRGLERLGGADLSLKWPNDVVDARGAKLAGVLVESRGLQTSAPHYVAGFGVNVTRREFPAELVKERPVTSLALCGVETDAERALEGVLDELEASGIAAISSAVGVDLVDHSPQLGRGGVLAERAHDGAQLLGGDGPVAVLAARVLGFQKHANF